jgi:hypothetical protein
VPQLVHPLQKKIEVEYFEKNDSLDIQEGEQLKVEFSSLHDMLRSSPKKEAKLPQNIVSVEMSKDEKLSKESSAERSCELRELNHLERQFQGSKYYVQ